MVSTDSGMMISLRLDAPLNAPLPIFFTPSAMITTDSLESLNADPEMSAYTVLSPVRYGGQYRVALISFAYTIPSRITYDSLPESIMRDSSVFGNNNAVPYHLTSVALAGILICVIAVPLNAESPIFLRFAPRAMLFREEQSANAESPISTNVSGITTLSSFEQPQNALGPIDPTLFRSILSREVH